MLEHSKFSQTSHAQHGRWHVNPPLDDTEHTPVRASLLHTCLARGQIAHQQNPGSNIRVRFLYEYTLRAYGLVVMAYKQCIGRSEQRPSVEPSTKRFSALLCSKETFGPASYPNLLCIVFKQCIPSVVWH